MKSVSQMNLTNLCVLGGWWNLMRPKAVSTRARLTSWSSNSPRATLFIHPQFGSSGKTCLNTRTSTATVTSACLFCRRKSGHQPCRYSQCAFLFYQCSARPHSRNDLQTIVSTRLKSAQTSHSRWIGCTMTKLCEDLVIRTGLRMLVFYDVRAGRYLESGRWKTVQKKVFLIYLSFSRIRLKK